MSPLSNDQRWRLRELVVDLFDYDSLEELLDYRLNNKLGTIVLRQRYVI